MRFSGFFPALLLTVVFEFAACSADPGTPGDSGSGTTLSRVAAVKGPLKVSAENPRYFTDKNGKAIYLTGSHTWGSLQDFRRSGNALRLFDHTAYLDFLVSYKHNFTRLWAWESSRTRDHSSIRPLPYLRAGPGNALDGEPRFDLTLLNQEYFDRLRARTLHARDKGIYVMVMLFQGASMKRRAWSGHPYNSANNVNGIDGDPNGDGNGSEVHTLRFRAVTELQEAYVRKVVDTVNDLDNVLYEIGNEIDGDSTEWQYHMINTIHDYQRAKPKQHPVVMTVQVPKDNKILFDSPAEAISPGDGDYPDDPPPADGSKVVISDTDHLWGLGGDQRWVWKSFLRGINPIFMDPYDGAFGARAFDPQWEPARRNMGYTLAYARRINLNAMVPRGDLVSSGYCLANPGAEYLVYLPAGRVAVDLSAATRELSVEWFDPATGKAMSAAKVSGGGKRTFSAPFNGDAVLYLKAKKVSGEQ